MVRWVSTTLSPAKMAQGISRKLYVRLQDLTLYMGSTLWTRSGDDFKTLRIRTQRKQHGSLGQYDVVAS